MNKFKVGDRVRLKIDVSDSSLLKKGRVGVVCDLDDYLVGVALDNFTEGHNCDNTAPSGTGWYVDVSWLGYDKVHVIKQFYEAMGGR